jgi:hypothetical protein
MARFKVWNPDEESEDDAELIRAQSPEDAAEIHIAAIWSGFVDAYEVMVADEDGNKYEVTVDVDYEPSFSAMAIKL